MAGIFDWLTDALLVMMSLLGIIRAKRLDDAIAVFAALLEVRAVELYREVELYLQDHWPNELSALDVHQLGKDFFVREAAAHHTHPLLLEALCRLKNVQLTIWDYERHSCDIYGHHGPMYNAAILDGSFVALIGAPVIPWYQKVHRELDPSTSQMDSQQPQIGQLHPVEMRPGDVILVREEFTRSAPQSQAEPSYREASVQWEELPARIEEEFEPQDQDETQPHNQPEHETVLDDNIDREIAAAPALAVQRPQVREGEDHHEPVFRPADIRGLPPHIVAELLPPQEAPYEFRNNKIVCCLPHCKVPHKEFKTIGGWRKHVALAKYHLDDAFCTLCGHYLIMPDGLPPEHIKAYIKAHKAERCVGVSKTILRQRCAEAERLEALMRTASHIQLPDEDGMAQQAAEETDEQPAARRKRAYPTEEARRADICAGYLKKFKCDQPVTMAEIAQFHDLQIP